MGLLRRHMGKLEKHFVVVSWDQRGAGKSFAANKPNSSMKINQFISDACELTKMLSQRFNQKKIFLAGHSWGSVIGILSKELIWFENSAHLPNIEENEKFTDLLINHVLSATSVQTSLHPII